MLKNIRSVVLAALLITFSSSCKKEKPKDVLSEGQMIEVLYDIHLAQNISIPSIKDSDMKQGLFNGVMEKHEVTQDRFEKSLDWYSKDMNKYMKINDSVLSLLKTENARLKKIETDMFDFSNKLTTQKRPERFLLTRSTPSLSFKIDSTAIRRDFPDFQFRLDILGIPSAGGKLQGELMFTYKDTIVIEKMDISGDSHYCVSKPVIADSLLKTISGFVRLPVNRRDDRVLLYNIRYQKDSLSHSNSPYSE